MILFKENKHIWFKNIKDLGKIHHLGKMIVFLAEKYG